MTVGRQGRVPWCWAIELPSVEHAVGKPLKTFERARVSAYILKQIPQPRHNGSNEMPVLNDPQKTEIVRLLAAFHTPTGVVVKLQEESGLCVDRAQVIRYDPTKACYEGGDKWRAIFWEARKKYLQEIASIPIAHAGFRLNQLHNIFLEAERRGNIRMALRALAQAAQEAYAIPIGGSSDVLEPPMDADEARRALKEFLARATEMARQEAWEAGHRQGLEEGRATGSAGGSAESSQRAAA